MATGVSISPSSSSLSVPRVSRNASRSRTVALVVAAVLVQATFATLYSAVPPNPDQMELNYTGWRILHGEVPYVDFISMNWPGAHWMHMASIAAFGNNLHAWRIADALLMLVTLWCVAWFLRDAFDSAVAAIALITYPVLFYAGGWLTGQRDFVIMHLLLIAACCHWKAWTSSQAVWQVGTGLCVAAATLIKPPFLLALPLMLCHGVVMARRVSGNRRRFAVQSGVAVLATAAGLLLGLGVVLAEGTPLARLWEATVDFHLTAYVHAKKPIGTLLTSTVSWLTGPWWWNAILAVASPLWFVGADEPRKDRAKRAYLLLLLFVGLSLVSVVWQGQGYMYHGSGLYVCLILLSFLTVGSLVRWMRRGPMLARLVSTAFAALFVLGVASRIKTFYWMPFLFLTGHLVPERYYADFTAGSDMSCWEAISTAKTIREAAKDFDDRNKTILVWSFANVINNESGFRQATRFHTPPVLLLARPPFRASAAWREAFITDLKRARPFACVVADEFMKDDANDAIVFLRRFLAENYVRVSASQGSALYLRKQKNQVGGQDSLERVEGARKAFTAEAAEQRRGVRFAKRIGRDPLRPLASFAVKCLLSDEGVAREWFARRCWR